jgi:hypothetical protein
MKIRYKIIGNKREPWSRVELSVRTKVKLRRKIR